MQVEHHHDTCALCKAASAHHTDHYAIGRWRIRMGSELGMSDADAQMIPLRELIQNHRKLVGLES